MSATQSTQSVVQQQQFSCAQLRHQQYAHHNPHYPQHYQHYQQKRNSQQSSTITQQRLDFTAAQHRNIAPKPRWKTQTTRHGWKTVHEATFFADRM